MPLLASSNLKVLKQVEKHTIIHPHTKSNRQKCVSDREWLNKMKISSNTKLIAVI